MVGEDTENVEEEAESGSESSGGVSKTLLIVIIACFVLFLAAAGAGFYILLQKQPPPNTAAVTAPEAASEKKAQVKSMGPIFSMKPFVVNLAGSGGNRFLRIKIDFELKDQQVLEQVHVQLPRVKDRLLTILSAKRFQDIDTVEGKGALRSEIAAAMDGIFSEGAVVNVYFTEFVIE